MSEQVLQQPKRVADPIDFDDPEIAYAHLDANMKKYMAPADIELVRKAYEFGAHAHRDQKRQSGAPYITHPLTVANILTDLKIDRSSLIAAILHDTVEDTETTLDEIKLNFGEEVAELVDGLTKIAKIRFNSTQERMAENFRKMILAMSKDLRVILIKLADRLHNMRTLDNLPQVKCQRIAQETVDIYAPLAGRLGIYGIKSELEDLCLRQLKPDIYGEIKKNVAKKREVRQSYINEVTEILREKLIHYGFKDFEVYGRPKHFFSIYKKMTDRQLDFEDIFDLFAFRVIVNTVKECYEVLGVVHSLWKPMPGRFKDYIAMPKPNLYQSLHTTVIRPDGDPAEIQIRTRAMHEVSELGIAAHWAYKQKGQGAAKKDDLQKFSWLRQIMQWQSELQDPNEFLEAVRVDLFDEEIFVFTPKGDVIALPQKASCLDFAFSVHTDVGLKTVGAKVNGRMVPIKKLLKSGDIVEIITSKNQKPNKDWLAYVYTSKAKNKIRAFLRVEDREKSKVLGQNLLQSQLHRIGKNYDDIAKSEKERDFLVHAAREGNFDDLLTTIGYGKIDAETLLRKAYPTFFDTQTEKEEDKFKLKHRPKKPATSGVTVSGLDNVLVHYAKCCNPLPGEEVVGFITRGRGVSVHRASCTRALDLDPARKVQVNWQGAESSQLGFAAYIRVIVQDRPGTLGEVSTAISVAGANINRAQIVVLPDMTGRLDFEIMIRGLGQLQTVINKVEMMPFVLSVQRMSEFQVS